MAFKVPDDIIDTTCQCGHTSKELKWEKDIDRNMYMCAYCKKPSPHNRYDAERFKGTQVPEFIWYNKECVACERWYTVPRMPDPGNGICPRCCEQNGVAA